MIRQDNIGFLLRPYAPPQDHRYKVRIPVARQGRTAIGVPTGAVILGGVSRCGGRPDQACTHPCEETQAPVVAWDIVVLCQRHAAPGLCVWSDQ